MELKKELVRLCDALNRAGIKYIVVGGCAVILHGYYRTTHDIDLIVDAAPETIHKMKEVADKDKEGIEIEGVIIPVCGLSTLIETKKGIRPKDKEDLLFLMGKKEYFERHRKND